MAFIGGRYVLQQAVEVVEQVARVPLSIAGVGMDFVGQLGARFRLAMGGAQHEQQNEAAARQQQAIAQQRQAATPQAARQARELAAVRRYVKDRLRGEATPAEMLEHLPMRFRQYLEVLRPDELRVLERASRGAIKASLQDPGRYTVDGIRSMKAVLGVQVPGHQQFETSAKAAGIVQPAPQDNMRRAIARSGEQGMSDDDFLAALKSAWTQNNTPAPQPTVH
ncbi:hypothetical protein FHR90_003331 [Endobacter medicaginis]|uniref:Uncharacterized protein n=1 Tax=Endobacter medicaginis TaxID=1181271 RepID=A0A839V3Q2_9PROT|nr:hypothetical protein [Endobacter medicaginis]MBB3175475.1 hypothetical protein [Endobacter medicaginis]MCX5477134.1 hypothetical protein [Endobacter medicaginis]NVN29817.1 hypothetical protein [Endobacter medicaginis]